MKRTFIALIAFIPLYLYTSIPLSAQCELPDNKKVEKLYDDAQKEKNPKERRELLKKIIDMEPEHYAAIYDYAASLIKLAS